MIPIIPFKKRCSRKGLALVVVLWMAVLMVVLASVTSQSSLLDTRISHVDIERQRCRWACRAGIETAIAILLEDDPGYDCLWDDWGPDSGWLEDLDFDGCTVNVTVTDTASKLNLNLVTREQLMYLPDMTDEIADSILDWRDSDDDVRASGTEEGYYLNLDVGYRTQNGNFKTTRELLRVRGVSEGWFYGDPEQGLISAENEGWENYLTYISAEANVNTSGEEKIDLNSASQQQLQEGLSIPAENARWIVNNRRFRNYSSLLTGSSSSGQSTNAGTTGTTNSAATGNTRNTATGGSNTSGASNTQQSQAVQPDTATALSIIDNASLGSRASTAVGRVNINTAGVIVLTAVLEGNRELAQSIVVYRDGLAGGFTSMADLEGIEGITQDALSKLADSTTIRSSIYEIDCVATSRATNLEYHVKAIVNRDESEGRIIYWREGSNR